MAARAAVLDQLERDHPEVDAAGDEEHIRVAQARVGGRQIVEKLGHHLQGVLDAHPLDEEDELYTPRGIARLSEQATGGAPRLRGRWSVPPGRVPCASDL